MASTPSAPETHVFKKTRQSKRKKQFIGGRTGQDGLSRYTSSIQKLKPTVEVHQHDGLPPVTTIEQKVEKIKAPSTSAFTYECLTNMEKTSLFSGRKQGLSCLMSRLTVSKKIERVRKMSATIKWPKNRRTEERNNIAKATIDLWKEKPSKQVSLTKDVHM